MNIYKWLLKRQIPKDVFDFEHVIMHITDTPDGVYSFLKRLVELVEPEVIIHTGDLVDNIKLELSRKDIDLYEKRVCQLMSILRKKSVRRIYCIGNHDDEQLMKKYMTSGDELYHSICLNLWERNYWVSHKYEALTDGDFYLFGHNIDVKSYFKNGCKVLNGLTGVYLIDGRTGQTALISYPIGTDDERQKKFKWGM